MLHVRVVSPADRTGQLVEALAMLPGVQNLVVQAGARRPEGDAVVFDVRDGAANPVFATLRELGLDRDGLIAVQRVDAVLDHTDTPVKRTRYMAREIAPVWEMVEATIRSGMAAKSTVSAPAGSSWMNSSRGAAASAPSGSSWPSRTAISASAWPSDWRRSCSPSRARNATWASAPRTPVLISANSSSTG